MTWQPHPLKTWRRLLILAMLCGSDGAALAQDTVEIEPRHVFAEADQALAEGRPEAARRLILDFMAKFTEEKAMAPALGAAALQLSRIEQLSGNFTAAEHPLREALRALPPADPAVQPVLAAIYISLGDLALARGDSTRAQIALLKGIAIARRLAVPDDIQILEAELGLATAEIRSFRLLQAANRLSELANRISADQPEFARVAYLYQVTLAELHFRRYEFSPALNAQKRALALSITLYGENHPETARSLTSLGSGLFNAGDFAAAETALMQAIALYDKAPAAFAPALATALVNLGQIYYVTGRSALAITGFTRAVAMAQGSLGNDSQIEAAARLHRGYALLRQGNLALATADLNAAISIWSLPTTANPRARAGAGIWLSEAERRLGNLDRAEAVLAQSEHILTEIFGPTGFALTDVMVGAGQIALARGLPVKADEFVARALAIREAALGPEHLAVEDLRSLSAVVASETGRVDEALAILEASVVRIRQRVALIRVSQSSSAIEEIAGLRRIIGRYVQVVDTALRDGEMSAKVREDLIGTSVLLAQLARSSAAGTAIAGMSRRIAAADQAAAGALRRLQEAQLRWQLATRQLTAMVIDGQALPEEIAIVRMAAAAEAAQIQTLQAELARDYPELAATTGAPVVPLAEIQADLQPDEILIAYLTLEERSYAWRVSPQSAELVELPGDSAAFKAEIDALRATIDPKIVQSLSDIVPFATVEAWSLYRSLLAPLDLPEDPHQLIVVPDGTLQSLPFAALLQAAPTPVADFADYRRLPWLIRRHALSVLPEIAAFTGLRGPVAASAATAPFIGFGDPVLTGQGVDPASVVSDDPAVSMATLLRGLAPLPDSANELAEIAEALGAEPGAVHTGSEASEASVKALPLSRYRVIAFATHGLMAGDFGRLREPGLALTPPDNPAGEEDGLLTMGEIARLHLDADWVILSACNTAAADGSPGAEGLSGLARAFFFAGSRSLLVSQWEVLSVAAVQLTTGIFTQMKLNPQLTRAGALQRSMLEMLGEDQPDFFAHPIFWAPFQLVGEGGR